MAANESAPSNPFAKRSVLTPTVRLFALAAAFAALTVVAYIAILVFTVPSSARFPSLAVFALLLLLGKVALDKVARWAAPSQGTVITSLAAAALAPLFVIGAFWALAEPLVSSSFRCGTGDVMLLMAAPFPIFLWACLAVLVAGAILSSGRGERLRPAIRGAAGVAAVFSGVMVTLASIRAAQKPDVNVYISTLPVTAVIAKLPNAEQLPKAPEGAGNAEDILPLPATRVIVDDLAIFRSCFRERCVVGVGPAAAVQDESLPTGEFLSLGSPDRDVVVKYDKAHHFVVLESGGRVALGDPSQFPFHTISWRPHTLWPAVDVHVRNVSNAVSAPIGGIGMAALSLAVSLGLLLYNHLQKKALRVLLKGAWGTLGDNGWVTFGDGRKARVDPKLALKPGEVLILKPSVGLGAYRDSHVLGLGEVAAGSPDEHRERVDAKCTRVAAWALAVATIGIAPLISCAVAGLVAP
ncbi:MAG: hypothetical protein IPK82_24865 [Polyangiaceae bacterium]|nr:hypothetical protein [Polyangiaceae bacterium]